MNVNDKVCNLECVQKGGTVQEFVGPVKIVLVDPPKHEYKRKKCGAAFIAVANLMIGANTVLMLLFVLGFKLPIYINSHIILCTVGFQFCMPLAILMTHSLFGAAAPLTRSHKRIEHVTLHLIGLACSVSGSTLAVLLGENSVIEPTEKYSSIHFFSGSVAVGLAGICLLTGPCVYCLICLLGDLRAPSCFTWIHRFFGILAFVASSVSFITGILKQSMLIWLYIIGYNAPLYIIGIFTVFYTLVIIATPFMKLICKRNKNEK